MSWEKNEKNNKDWDLYLDFPNNENSHAFKKSFKDEQLARYNKFKENLILITKDYHERFLKTRQIPIHEYQYQRQQSWHSDFDIEKITPIKNGPLPPKPQISKTLSIKKFLELDNSQENDPMRSALMKVSNKYNNEEGTPSKYRGMDSPLKRSSLGKQLISIVKEKERVANEQRQINSERENQKNFDGKGKELVHIAQMLKMHYATRGVSNMFLTKVVDHVAKTNKSFHMSLDETISAVNYLCEAVPSWVK